MFADRYRFSHFHTLFALLLLTMLPGAAVAQINVPDDPPTGVSAPDFTAVGLDGQRYSGDRLHGRIVVLNFWYLGCAPCRAEIPHLNRLVAEFAPRNVLFLAPTTDATPELKRFLRRTDFTYKVIPQAADLIHRVFRTPLFPTHLVIDQHGTIVARLYGATERGPDDLRRVLLNLLAGQSLIADSSAGSAREN